MHTTGEERRKLLGSGLILVRLVVSRSIQLEEDFLKATREKHNGGFSAKTRVLTVRFSMGLEAC